MSNTTPTPIVDRNGKQTTVHKKINSGSGANQSRVSAARAPQTTVADAEAKVLKDIDASLTQLWLWKETKKDLDASRAIGNNVAEPSAMEALFYSMVDSNYDALSKAKNSIVNDDDMDDSEYEFAAKLSSDISTAMKEYGSNPRIKYDNYGL